MTKPIQEHSPGARLSIIGIILLILSYIIIMALYVLCCGPWSPPLLWVGIAIHVMGFLLLFIGVIIQYQRQQVTKSA